MAEEAVGTWDRLWNLLTEDDRARWKLISWTILGSGTIGAVDLALFDSGVEDTTILMCFAVLVMALFGTGWYCVFGRLPQRDQERLPRRRLVFQFSLGLLAVLLSASLSTVQARILNSELEHATAAQNLPDVAGILNRAQNANVRLKQPSMDVIRRRLLMMNSADAPGAWDALLAYASYATTVRKAPSVGSTKMPTGARWSFQVPIDDPDWEKKISISPYQAPAGSFALFQPITTIQNDDPAPRSEMADH